MQSRLHKLLLVSLVSVGLSACAKNEPPPAPPEPVAESEPEPEPEPEPDPEDVRIEGDHLKIDRMIQFALDSDEILEESNEILDHIAQALKNHSEIVTLQVIGHTDESGDHDHNQDLSERRAASVVAALRDRGISQEIDSSGVGETDPECTEDTDECHETNRRVEFIVK